MTAGTGHAKFVVSPNTAARKNERTNMNKVNFSTYSYRLAHGKEPRGRGSWGFCPTANYGDGDYLDHVVWSKPCSFAEAKKDAAALFRSKGISEVTVCS